MNHSGFSFLFETAIALLLVMLLFLQTQQKFETGSHELIMSQKMHDLLVVWAKERNFSPEELQSDFEFVFPQMPGAIDVGGKKIYIGPPTENNPNKFVESINYVGEDFTLKKITLTVFD